MRLFVIGLLALMLSSGCLSSQRVEAASGEDLIQAAKCGNKAKVSKLLQSGADVNHADIDGNTALIWALRGGHTETVSKLLQSGANVNHASNHGSTPLTWAARKGHTKNVSMLLQSGANVNHANNGGYTPLTFSAREGHTEIVSKLLQSGANVNHATNSGDTALILAASNGHTEIVSKLLHRGANVNHANKAGGTAATMALKMALKDEKGTSVEVIIDIIGKLRKYEKIQKRKTEALIKEFDKLPPEMRVEIMNYMHGSDETDQLAKTLKSKLTAEQMMLLYLFKKDARPVIKKLKDNKPNAMQLDFIGLPAQLQEAIIKKYDATLYNRLMKRQQAVT